MNSPIIIYTYTKPLAFIAYIPLARWDQLVKLSYHAFLKTLGAFFLDDCGPYRTRTAFRHCERLVLANYTIQPILVLRRSTIKLTTSYGGTGVEPISAACEYIHVRPLGLEPRTPTLKVWCANQLCHERIKPTNQVRTYCIAFLCRIFKYWYRCPVTVPR